MIADDHSTYSVLMSVYRNDRPEWLKAALESMAQQTLPAKEIVLVADGPISDDLEVEIQSFSAAYPDILKFVRLDSNVGLGPALNVGLPFCTGDVIARMDADDISNSERCKIQMDRILEGYDMVGCNVSEFSADPKQPNAIRELPESHDDIVQFSKRRSPFAHPAFMVSRAALNSVGGYRNIHYAEDFDLFIRLLRHGYKGCNIQANLVSMRVDSDAYKRRGGCAYLYDMISFNVLELREGWFSPRDFLVRSVANIAVSLIPNSARDFVYKHVLRKNKS